jgi:hypothetical protein
MMVVGIIVVMMVAVMMATMALMPVAIVAAGDRVSSETAQNRAADCADRTMRCDAADNRATTRSKNCACGVIMPAAGIRHGRNGGCAKNDDGGHYHRSCLFQHGILPICGQANACP